MDQSPADMTLDELRPVLARTLPRHAGFDGWSDRAVASAAAELGVDPSVAYLVFGGDRIDMIDAWFLTIDEDMATQLTSEQLSGMKVRERITSLIEARLGLSFRIAIPCAGRWPYLPCPPIPPTGCGLAGVQQTPCGARLATQRLTIIITRND